MSEGKIVISYMVARTTLTDETKVEVVETHMTLMEANLGKIQAFQRPDTAMAWVERLEQKRIGEILDKRKGSGRLAND